MQGGQVSALHLGGMRRRVRESARAECPLIQHDNVSEVIYVSGVKAYLTVYHTLYLRVE